LFTYHATESYVYIAMSVIGKVFDQKNQILLRKQTNIEVVMADTRMAVSSRVLLVHIMVCDMAKMKEDVEMLLVE